MTDVRLRKPTADDFDEVYGLLQQLWQDRALDLDRLREVFLTQLSSDCEEYRIAEVEGRVVGFGSLVMKNSLWAEGRWAQVQELVVDEVYRGRGIGTQLLDGLTEIARVKGCARIELDSAFHRTEAHGFYEARGFRKRAYWFSKEL
jgi:ribosomal protein S18 acetylase RimI-like enzyme